jgi:putative peptide zinc metalloprotease protein
VSALGVVLIIAALGVLPVPHRGEAEGVVWIPDEAFVRAGTEGFVEEIVARPGSWVERGTVLLVLRDPQLTTRVSVLEARRRELLARYIEQQPTDRVKAEIIKEDLEYVEQSLTRARQQAAELVVLSRTAGTLVVPTPEDLPGRFVRQGDLLGHVVDLQTITVRAVVTQTEIDLVRARTRGVDVRLAERLAQSLPAVLRRVVPSATDRLPTPALGSGGGGRIAVDPRDSHGVTAIQRLFEVDVELPAQAGIVNVGGRAYVRFDHGWAPLATQWYRQIRQLFLARFNV